MTAEKNEIMEKALSLLTIRAHSRKELQQKLIKKSFNRRGIENVLNECERLNLINDGHFAQAYAEELRGRGYGAYRVKNALGKKGLSRELIDSIMENFSNDGEAGGELELGKKVMLNKLRLLRGEHDPVKKRQKVYRFMAARGFSSAVISDLLNKLSEEINHEGDRDY